MVDLEQLAERVLQKDSWVSMESTRRRIEMVLFSDLGDDDLDLFALVVEMADSEIRGDGNG